MSENKHFDVTFIGGGPGGYTGAIRMSQLINPKTNKNFTVACVEKDKLGGTCLNRGCIPTKSLLTSTHHFEMIKSGHINNFGVTVSDVKADFGKMNESKDKIVSELNSGIGALLKANNVVHINGTASFVNTSSLAILNCDGLKSTITSDYFVVATGSFPLSMRGIADLDEETIISSDSALFLKEAPKKVVIVGAGVIGLELGSVWSRLGSEVIILDFAESVASTMDADVSRGLESSLAKRGIKFKLGVAVDSITKNANGAVVKFTHKDTNKGSSEEITCDKVLLAIGRGAYTASLNSQNAGIALDDRGRIVTDHLKTNICNIFAIGDVTTGPMLAHKSEEEGVMAAEMIAGQCPIMNHDFIPAVIYTHPEAASIGKTEEQLKKDGIEYVVGKAPFAANGRAKTLQDTEGFVKIICDKDCNEIYGAHILHSSAGTLINEIAAYLAYSPCSPDDIALTCHSHPDLNETIKAAALDALGRPLSTMPKRKK